MVTLTTKIDRRAARRRRKYPWLDAVRERYEHGEPLRYLAQEHGVPETTLHAIKRDEHWDLEGHRSARARGGADVPAGHQRCYQCQQVKPLDAYHWKAGKRRETCAECRAELRDYRTEYESRRIADRLMTWRRDGRLILFDEARRTRSRFRRHLRRVERELIRRTPMTIEERRARWLEYQRLRRLKHPVKEAARRAVTVAVATGRIEKPTSCQDCGEEVSEPRLLHGHHHRGYSLRHWYDVRWLCVPCHVRAEGGWGRSLGGPQHVGDASC